MKKVEHRPDTLPPLEAGQRDELGQIAARPDDTIDTGDVPELTGRQLARMQRGRFCRPVKMQITARVGADVLAWLRSRGRGYQSRMNAILRRAMLEVLRG